MIKQFKNGLIQWFWILTILWIVWVTYAAVTQVSTGETLTATIFNESMVPTWAVMAFYWNSCPAWWNKADWSGDEKMVDWTVWNLDLRWEFIRWFDDWRGIDSSRWLATFQADELKSHVHNTVGLVYYGWGSWWFPTWWYGLNSRDTTAYWWSETRPRNIALLYCVKN